MMRVYVTKYALTMGIQLREGTLCTGISDRMIDCGRFEFFHKPHWHETWEDAKAQAEMMRSAKIRLLEKSLAKMRALEFKEPC